MARKYRFKKNEVCFLGNDKGGKGWVQKAPGILYVKNDLNILWYLLTKMWELTQNEVVKYDEIFLRLNPIGGKLDGEKVKQVMMKSQLSVETLGKVWDLADIDSDGFLDRSEFLLAMHLVYRCTEGDMLPDRLPGHILFGKDQYFAKYPPTFTVGGSLPARDSFTNAFPSSMALIPISTANAACSPGVDGKTQPLALTYVPPSQMSTSYPKVSPSVEVSGQQQYASTLLLSLSSSGTAAATAVYPSWSISSEEFTKASALFSSIDVDADGLVSGLETRDVLMSSHLQQNVLAHIWDLVDLHGVGMLNREQFAVVLHLVSEQIQALGKTPDPLPDHLPPALVPPSLRPVPPDPTIFEESNKLVAQIEAINKECCVLEASHAQLDTVSRRQAAESAENTRIAEAHEKAAHSLVEQNAEAGRRLGEYAAQRDALRDQLEELRQKVDTEHQQVDEVRSQLDSQQAVVRKQENELTRLRDELNELIREETQLHDQVAGSQRRLEAIEAENREAKHRVEQTNLQVSLLESTRGQLMEVMDQYRAILNGDTSTVEPNETRVKLLLTSDVGSNSLTGSFASFDTGIGGGGWTGPQSPPTDSPFNGTSAGVDWLPPESTVASGKADWPDRTTDPFGSSSQPFVFDPFKTNDPFASDPFGFTNSTSNLTDGLLAFDPFVSTAPHCPPPKSEKEPVPAAAAASALTDSDFDTVFGQPVNLFSADPFSAVEQCAEQQSADASTGDALGKFSTIPKRFPPPRPKTQPGAGKLVSGRKSTGDQPDHYILKKGTESASPTAPKKQTSSWANKKLSSGSSRSFQLLSRTRSKKDLGTSGWKSHAPPSAVPPSAASVPLRELTEEQQLSLATMESAKLAQEDAKARQKEEEELQLVIQLSKMDA